METELTRILAAPQGNRKEPTKRRIDADGFDGSVSGPSGLGSKESELPREMFFAQKGRKETAATNAINH